jgi:hypothetical protein
MLSLHFQMPSRSRGHLIQYHACRLLLHQMHRSTHCKNIQKPKQTRELATASCRPSRTGLTTKKRPPHSIPATRPPPTPANHNHTPPLPTLRTAPPRRRRSRRPPLAAGKPDDATPLLDSLLLSLGLPPRLGLHTLPLALDLRPHGRDLFFCRQFALWVRGGGGEVGGVKREREEVVVGEVGGGHVVVSSSSCCC